MATDDIVATTDTSVVVPDVIAPVAPTPVSIIAPRGNFASYMESLIERAMYAVEACKESIAEAERGIEAAQADKTGTQSSRWRRMLTKRLKEKKNRERFLRALQEGYVPLPKMPAIRLEYAMHTMPPDVLDAMDEARQAGVFEEFRIIDGRSERWNGHPDDWKKNSQRDPIVVGLINGEPFAIAWWRP